MLRNLAMAAILCLVATAAFAQSGFAGKWATDPPDPAASWPGNARNSSLSAEFTVDGDKATGTLSIGGLGGTFFVIDDGKVKGNLIRFRTTVTVDPRTGQPLSVPANTSWTVELVDDRTIRISRQLELMTANVLDLIQALVGTGADRQFVPAAPPAAPPVAPAFDGSAPLSGVVADSSKAPIPGATVAAKNVDTGITAQQITNGSGAYSFPALGPGTYEVSAELLGFTKSVQKADLPSAGQVRLNLILQVGQTPPPSTTTAAYSGRDGYLLHRVK